MGSSFIPGVPASLPQILAIESGYLPAASPLVMFDSIAQYTKMATTATFGAVDTPFDFSGNGFDLALSSGSTKQFFRNSGLNGLPSIESNGSAIYRSSKNLVFTG